MTLNHIGPYRVIRKVGEGGMGEVFEAVHETIARRVAVKVLRPEFARSSDAAARFINEARAVNIVEHPSIVQVSDYGHLPSGATYIVMEFLRGVTLGEHVRHAGGRLPVPELLRIARQIASALAAAHEKEIIHRDLKPDLVAREPDPAGCVPWTRRSACGTRVFWRNDGARGDAGPDPRRRRGGRRRWRGGARRRSSRRSEPGTGPRSWRRSCAARAEAAGARYDFPVGPHIDREPILAR